MTSDPLANEDRVANPYEAPHAPLADPQARGAGEHSALLRQYRRWSFVLGVYCLVKAAMALFGVVVARGGVAAAPPDVVERLAAVVPEMTRNVALFLCLGIGGLRYFAWPAVGLLGVVAFGLYQNFVEVQPASLFILSIEFALATRVLLPAWLVLGCGIPLRTDPATLEADEAESSSLA